MAKKTTLQEFEAVFPTLEKVLVDDVASYGLPEAYVEWFRKVRPPRRRPSRPPAP